MTSDDLQPAVNDTLVGFEEDKNHEGVAFLQSDDKVSSH